MNLYLDIDGVLLDYNTDTYANGSIELIEYITSEFDCYWLTTHCKGDSMPAIEYLSNYFPQETIEKLKTVKATYWEDLKTEGIDFDKNFIWLDDYPFQAELSVLEHFGVSDSIYKVDLRNENELLTVLNHLKGIVEKKRQRRRNTIIACLILLAVLIVSKILWMTISNWNLGNFETEKNDILKRRNYLIEQVVVGPQDLLNKMPAAVGTQFQGEWALYSASMLSASLTNIAHIYPETKQESLQNIDKLIQIVMSPELRQYDTDRWGEDPLETLDGDESHISYISHLAWMISGYKQLGGDKKYDTLYKQLCETMNRRILQSPNLNLQTYPGEFIYVPDMLVAIVALANYSKQNKGEYWPTVNSWLQLMQDDWIDEKSGQIASFIPDEEVWVGKLPAKGSYSALSCYYLTFVDEEFAKEQYDILRKNFFQKKFITGFREYYDKRSLLGFDIDAGPILFNLSPTGTAFGIGPATYFEEWEARKGMLKTAELAGFTVRNKIQTHYLLANIALVGEAITLAMRTACKWN